MKNKISVLMSVYKNDLPQNVITAVESIENQTLPPDQVVMVVDGQVSEELSAALTQLRQIYKNFEVYPLEKNVGLGNALRIGTDYCRNEFIARMDSDDIAVPDRFEKEMACFEADEDLSVVGSVGQEFFDEPTNVADIKYVPETHEEIVEFMKGRCPFCHMSVMMKKDKLIEAGGYQDWYYAEDYYLWVRMYLAGAKFHNIQEPLVLIRINYDTFERRGGMKYYKSIRDLLKFMEQNKIIGRCKYNTEKAKRFVGHVLVPKKMKRRLYMKFMRAKVEEGEAEKE